uniref:Tudor domain-containing protein n=1 Tax=Megaselia scalaris TaxID=36166 RepID=T1H136_MEGSC
MVWTYKKIYRYIPYILYSGETFRLCIYNGTRPKFRILSIHSLRTYIQTSFELPDINFAVEQMLHQSSLAVPYKDEYTNDGYCVKISFEDGRVFDLDLPQDTQCILDDYRLCHFHNPDFNAFAEDYRMQVAEAAEAECEPKRFQRIADSLLPNKYISCIRQLLGEGITPFPYKVAKALDPDMYRNIEFDSWNEIRKEIRAGLINWYKGGSNFQKLKRRSVCAILAYHLQVGVKCNIQLRGSQSDLLTCHIQEISADRSTCIVFIEETGKRKAVTYDSLKPLSGDQNKGWPLPVRIQKNYERYNERMRSLRQTIEYCTMPLTIEHDRNNNNNSGGRQADNNNNNAKDSYRKGCNESGCDSRQTSRAPSRSSEIPSRNENIRDDLSEGPPMQSPFCSDHNIYYENHEQIIPGPANVPIWPSYLLPGGGMYISSQTPIFSNTTAAIQHQAFSIRNDGGRSVIPNQSKINFDAKMWNESGNVDNMPEDISTMKFFYNLGLKYYKKTTERTGHDTKDPLILEMQSLSISEKMSNDQQVLEHQNKDQNNNNSQQYSGGHYNPFNQNPMQSNNHNFNHGNNHQQRKFHSRYFNRKDRPMNNNKNSGQGGFRNNQNSNIMNNNQPPTLNIPHISPNQGSGNDRGNQISPCVTQTPEIEVTPPTSNVRNYQPQQTPTIPYYVGGDGADYNPNPGGYYIFSQPTTPQPQQFGLYLTTPVPAPQSALSTPTPTNPNCPSGPQFSAFVGHPTGPVAVAPAGPVQPHPFFTPTGEVTTTYGAEPPFDSIPGYPPYFSYPCPLFYSPTNAATTTTPGSQG